jgi:hypothetical protein
MKKGTKVPLKKIKIKLINYSKISSILLSATEVILQS